jgi:hypothetical protein
MNMPTVTVCTDKFAGFAREKAAAFKAVGLPLVPIPHPITGRRPEEVEVLVRDSFVGVVEALTSTPGQETADEATSTPSPSGGDAGDDCE